MDPDPDLPSNTDPDQCGSGSETLHRSVEMQKNAIQDRNNTRTDTFAEKWTSVMK